jgi:hypothetical protein
LRMLWPMACGECSWDRLAGRCESCNSGGMPDDVTLVPWRRTIANRQHASANKAEARRPADPHRQPSSPPPGRTAARPVATAATGIIRRLNPWPGRNQGSF